MMNHDGAQINDIQKKYENHAMVFSINIERSIECKGIIEHPQKITGALNKHL